MLKYLIQYLHQLLVKNHYDKWFIYQPECSKQPSRCIHKQVMKSEMNVGLHFLTLMGQEKQFKRILKKEHLMVIFKSVHTLKSLLLHPKGPITNHLTHDKVIKGPAE